MHATTFTIDPPTRLLTPPQLSEMTGIAIGTLAKMRLRSDGPRFVKIGASVRYPEDAVRAWLSAQPRRGSTSDAGQPEAAA